MRQENLSRSVLAASASLMCPTARATVCLLPVFFSFFFSFAGDVYCPDPENGEDGGSSAPVITVDREEVLEDLKSTVIDLNHKVVRRMVSRHGQRACRNERSRAGVYVHALEVARLGSWLL